MPEPPSSRSHDRSELRRLLDLAVPLYGAQIAGVALPLTDMFYMGRLDPVALAGGGLGATLLATAILVGGSALGGLSPRVARAYATSDRSGLASYVRHARWLAVAVALLIGLLSVVAEPLLMAAGQGVGVAATATSYLVPASLSVPFTLGCTIQRGVLAACGRARMATLAWALAVPVNLALDHAFAMGLGPLPGLGLAGIGVATSLVSLCVLLFLVTAGARAGLESIRSWVGPGEAEVGRDLLSLGGPIVLAVGAEAGVFALSGIVVGWFGSASLAAHRVALLTAQVCFLAPLTIGQAAAIRVAASEVSGGTATAARTALVVALVWALGAGIGVIAFADIITTAFVADVTVRSSAFPARVARRAEP